MTTSLLEALFDLGRTATIEAVRARTLQSVDLERMPVRGREPGASFLTLTGPAGLRGCCGSIDPQRPLAEDVARNAWLTALEDPRFAAVGVGELATLELELSILGPLREVGAGSREELIGALVPGCSGLVVRNNDRRATFLPKVWQSFPDAHRFVNALLGKGRMAATPWPSGLRAWVYATETTAGPLLGQR
jgi:AmmeMemoRadiSam system protein A